MSVHSVTYIIAGQKDIFGFLDLEEEDLPLKKKSVNSLETVSASTPVTLSNINFNASKVLNWNGLFQGPGTSSSIQAKANYDATKDQIPANREPERIDIALPEKDTRESSTSSV